MPRAVNVVDVRDVATGTVDLIEQGGAESPVPMFGTDISGDALVQEVGRVVKIETPLSIPVSPAMVSIGATMVEATATTFGIDLPVTSVGMLLTMEDFDLYERGRFTATTPLDVTIADSINWYKQLSYC